MMRSSAESGREAHRHPSGIERGDLKGRHGSIRSPERCGIRRRPKPAPGQMPAGRVCPGTQTGSGKASPYCFASACAFTSRRPQARPMVSHCDPSTRRRRSTTPNRAEALVDLVRAPRTFLLASLRGSRRSTTGSREGASEVSLEGASLKRQTRGSASGPNPRSFRRAGTSLTRARESRRCSCPPAREIAVDAV